MSNEEDDKSVEDLITLTDVKPLTHFHDDSVASNRAANFQFDLPSDLSTIWGGTRYLPRPAIFNFNLFKPPSPGGLNDQRMVKGVCEVLYWIEVEFRLRGVSVGYLSKHIGISELYPCLQVCIDRPIHVSFQILPGYFAKSSHPTAINVALTLGQSDPCVRGQERDKQGTRYVSFPVTLTMNTRSVAGEFLNWDTRQSLKCHIKATWSMKVSVSPSRDQARAKVDSKRFVSKPTTTTSIESCVIFFRPVLYSGKTMVEAAKPIPCQSYAAISQLQIAIPDFIREPSYQWELLSKEYHLEILLAFDNLEKISLPKFQRTFRLVVVPCEKCTEARICTGDETTAEQDQEPITPLTKCESPLPLYC